METVSEIKKEEREIPQAKPPERKERYFVIKLPGMRDQFDTPQPIITVGNRAVKHQRIQMKRETWIPVTGSHIETLRNTKHTIWVSTVDENGNVVKTPQQRIRFPIDENIEITEEGYRALRQKVLGFTSATQKLEETDIDPYRK